MRDFKDFYYILGVKNSSTVEDIKKAYRKLSKKFHPDVNNQDDFFEERFKEIQEAYSVLSSHSERLQYDVIWNEIKNPSKKAQVNNEENLAKDKRENKRTSRKDSDSNIASYIGIFVIAVEIIIVSM